MAPRARCNFPGCTSYAAKDQPRCTRHRLAVPPPEETGFTRRLQDGTYQDLVGVRLSNQIMEAAQIAGLDNELGALRLVLERLLAHEDDPATLAASVPKLTGAIVQVMRAQRLLDDRAADSLQDAIATVIEELQPI